MRCKACDYPLWQIPDRRCPECGAGFKPSEFEFVQNSVRFCCRHCNQAYYGTGPAGHLVPDEFDCVTCGHHISMDEMILLPTEGVREEQTRVDVNPWLERTKTGAVRGWFFTVMQSMGMPGRLISGTPEHASFFQAAWFSVLSLCLYLFTSLLIGAVLFIGLDVLLSPGAGTGPRLTGSLGVFAFLSALLLVLFLVGALIWGVATHLLLRLTGPVSGSIGRTMQCLLYSSATNAVLAVPCINFYFGWIGVIWWTVSATLMVKSGQRVSGGRAAFATILPPVVAVFLSVAAFAMLVYFPLKSGIAAAQASARARAAGTPVIGSGSDDIDHVRQLAAAIRAHAIDYGAPPHHAAELIDTQRVWISVFVQSEADQTTRLDTVKIASMSLRNVGQADGETTDAVIAAANNSLPENVVAHRVGDMVFCYHGIDLSSPDPELWTVIGWPAPDAIARTGIAVGHADGSARTYPAGTFGEELAKQNLVRAAAGLPALPDPAGVDADHPATAPE